MNKPILIFDGDCGFCRRWIERWRLETGDAVDYEPYQKVASVYPHIPRENFEKSVQLIEAGKITSGAEAVLRSLSYAPKKSWLLRIYQKIPLFRTVSEAMYRLVANNRRIFSKLTWFFWGDDVQPSTFRFATFVFTRMLAVIFFFAFFSLGTQIKGLLGEQGILSAKVFLERVTQVLGPERYSRLPTLFWIFPKDSFLLFLCHGGAGLSLLLFLGVMPTLTMTLLWVFYLSLVSIGQDFLSFQWDALLLEVSFLSLFLVPLVRFDNFSKNYEPPATVRWLLKWLLFRLMLLSGTVKLASGDVTWRTFCALLHHYETQPLPPWTAWYVSHLPAFFQKFSCIFMFLIELIIPFFFFFPRRLRHYAAGLTIFFQLLIMATGNYCFFNLLTVAMCLLLLDDSFWFRFGWITFRPLKPFCKIPAFITFPVVFLVLFISLNQMSWIWQGGERHHRIVSFLERTLSPFRLVNSYGLFAIMTKVRNEIVVEGSLDGVEWKAYEFKFKPGDVMRRPAFVAPFQPRLDWQMWFAALGTYRENPWFINFCARLLENSPNVKKLLEKNPFLDQPPVYIRAKMYEYHFSSPLEKKMTGAWWMREEKGIYLPQLTLRRASQRQ